MDATNQYPITKSLITCGYPLTENPIEYIQSHVDNERKAGNTRVNHMLVRPAQNPDFIKFLFPLYIPHDGQMKSVPMVLFGANRAMRDGSQKVVTSGPAVIRHAIEPHISAHSLEGRLAHADEGNRISFMNTINQGLSVLNPEENEAVTQAPADLPLADFKNRLTDPDVPNYHIIIPVNSKKVASRIWERNYHWTVRVDKEEHPGKEAGLWNVNYSALRKSAHGLETYDIAFEGRKAYAGRGSGNMLVRFLTETKDGPSKLRAAQSIAYVSYLLLHERKALSWIARKGLDKLGRKLQERYDLKANPFAMPRGELPSFDVHTGERFANYALGGLRVKGKISQDPGAIIDVDSDEDYIRLQAAIQYAAETGKLRNLYPYIDDLIRTHDHVGGKWGVDYVDNFREVANENFRRYGLDAEFDSNGRLKQRMYSKFSLGRMVKGIARYNALI